MPRYRLSEGRLVNVDTGEPLNSGNTYVTAIPYVVSDTPGYRSPVTGEWIEGRKARREDLKKHDCVEVDPPARKRAYKNKKYAIANNGEFEG